MKKILLVFLFVLFKFGFSEHELKLLNHEKLANIKYVSEYEVTLDQGRFPREEFLLKIVKKEIEKNPNFENYFIHFYLPGMQYGAGAYAVSNILGNKIPKVEIIKYSLMDYPQYSDQLKLDKNDNYYIEDFKMVNKKNKEEKPNKNIEPLEKIGAKIHFDTYTENGKLYIKGYTNLPRKMELTLFIYNEDSSRIVSQDSIIIEKNGFFFNGPFNLRKGTYIFSISSPYSKFQGDDVYQILGEKSKILKSNITYEEDGYYFIKYEEKVIKQI